MADGGLCEPPIDRRSSQPATMRGERDEEAADGEATRGEAAAAAALVQSPANPNCVLRKKKKKTQLKLGRPMGQI